ncbi:MAG: riboflavin synthase [Ignavibacteriae bacterium]|nr:MAG: riboflavin synthase [Ignavibacteriota bacterium]
MFTGLIEETGIIKSIRPEGGSVIFTIQGKKTVKNLRVDQSIAVEGVCLTVIKRKARSFDVQAVEETLKKTTLGRLHAGFPVNLERPLLPSDRLGGHFVLGHVDGLGRVVKLENRESSWIFWIQVSRRYAHHLVPVGSIAVNGVSLTMAEVKNNSFAVSIIPHTMEVTTFKRLERGTLVNLEFDVLGKYVERLFEVKGPLSKK